MDENLKKDIKHFVIITISLMTIVILLFFSFLKNGFGEDYYSDPPEGEIRMNDDGYFLSQIELSWTDEGGGMERELGNINFYKHGITLNPIPFNDAESIKLDFVNHGGVTIDSVSIYFWINEHTKKEIEINKDNTFLIPANLDNVVLEVKIKAKQGFVRYGGHLKKIETPLEL